MKTKITILCENNVQLPLRLIGEYGLAILIESDDTTLYDTGQGPGIIHNLNILGKNIADIDRIIISHSHFDHVGGLMEILKIYHDGIPVYINPDAFKQKITLISTPDGNKELPIGWPFAKAEYEAKGAKFIPVTEFTKITDTIYSFSNIRRESGWKTWDARLKRKDNDGVMDDPFDDDLSLMLDTDSGPVVLLGCAHAGIVEILNNISEDTGNKEFYAVIGGAHLGTASHDYIEKTVTALRKFNVTVIGLSHCTGFEANCYLSTLFKKRFVNATVGRVFEF